MLAISHAAHITDSAGLRYHCGGDSRPLAVDAPETLTALGLAGDDTVIMARGSAISVMSVETGAETAWLQGESGLTVRHVASDAKQKVVAFCVDDSAFAAFGRTNRQIIRLETEGQITALTVAPGAPIIAVSDASHVRIFNVGNGARCVMTLEAPSPLVAVSFCPLAYMAAGLTDKGRLVVWDVISSDKVFDAPGFSEYTDLVMHDFDPLLVDLMSANGRESVGVATAEQQVWHERRNQMTKSVS